MNLQGRSSIVVRFVAAATFTAVAMVSCSDDGGGIRNPIAPTSPVAPQGGPDLGVASPSVSDSSPAAGAPFTLTVAVRNDGNAASAATTLRFYRSTDATITESDTAVGTAAVAGLSAARTLSESVQLTAPSAPGTYYYGACVDAVAGEPDTANNCSASVRVDVPGPGPEPEPEPEPTNPDLAVTSLSVSNSGPAAEASFTLSATVRNGGDGASAATTLRFYRSTDRAITATDMQVGTAAVAGLSASGSRGVSVDLTAPSAPGTYYYGACVDAVAEESDTTNNCSASMEVNVLETLEQTQGSPDLTVGSPTGSNSGPAAGETFALSATVRNAGDGESAATTLRYYQSTDGTITTSDTAVGTDAVAVLGASGSSSVSVDLTAPSSPGTYYYGACVDAVTGESDTTNNCSSAVSVIVSAAPPQTNPDLEVQSPSVNDSSLDTGASFTLSATVRNDGDGASAATTLRFYRSTDATITESDTAVGTAAVAELSAARTLSESVQLTAPSAPGTYYYGACVDAVAGEPDTANNCSASVRVDVPGPGPEPEPEPEPTNPDLAVTSLSVSNSGPAAEASFTLSATVRNGGDGASAATTLRFYRSTDRAITATDMQVGTAAVAGLSASGSRGVSVDLTAPSAPGTYYYGACVDAVAGESDTTNNCSASMEVNVLETLEQTQGSPDLTVGSPTGSNSGPAAGETFTLSATVRNAGDGESAATTLRYYRSTDATITSSDTEVGTDAVGELSAGATSPESISLTAPSAPGTYYYGACVDEVTVESDTTNNCSTSVQITVSEAATGPDLDPYAIVVATNPGGTRPGGNVGPSVGVRNDGDESSAATTVRFYQSTDATITTADTEVGTNALGALSPGATASIGATVSAPSAPGTYYYGACVDAVAGESDTTNNCSSAVSVTVSPPPPPGPDLGISGVVAVSGLYGITPPGWPLSLSAWVRNDGDAASAATTLRYYLSTDATITTSDTSVGTVAVGALAAGATSSSPRLDFNAPSSAGTYYYGACVDTVTGESDTTNNCSSAVSVTVSAPPPPPPPPAGPDLTVHGIITVTSLDGTPPGGSFQLGASVRNDGDESSAATTLRYYQSTDATITTSDTEVGTDTVGGLSAGATTRIVTYVTAPASAGTYYYGLCVDAVTGESDTTNNCSGSASVVVSESPPQTNPDLAVGSPSVSDSSPTTGATFTLSATVRNDGDGAAAATTLRYYRSTDGTITTSDTSVGTDAVGGLSAGATSPESISLTAPSSAGTSYYGACVDTVTGESDTTNNCSSAVSVTVSAPPPPPQTNPDLEVQSPSVNDSSLDTGDSFTLSATVRNDGDGAAAATTLRYYRSTDATITTTDTSVGTDAVGGLAAAATSSESIDLTAPSAPGTYYYGACVDAVAGESDTTNNCSSAVSVTVSPPPPPGPDLGISGVVAVSGLYGITPPGWPLSLSAWVRNDGDAASAATTLRYYLSTDATITTSDTSVGTVAVGALAAGATSSSPRLDFNAPSSAGTYYYGACVDTVTGESDTTNNCSSAVSVTVSAPPPPPPPPAGPDLTVHGIITVTSLDGTPPGGSFQLGASVRNDGDESSAATTLRYYQSTDATITTSDTEVGTDTVGGLSAGATTRIVTYVTAPASAGTYYYGLCVDAVTGESDTTNNCSGSASVEVTE